MGVAYQFIREPNGTESWSGTSRNKGIMVYEQDPEPRNKDQEFSNSLELQLLGVNSKYGPFTANCSPVTPYIMDGEFIKAYYKAPFSETYHGGPEGKRQIDRDKFINKDTIVLQSESHLRDVKT